MDAGGGGDGPPREAPEERTPQTPAPPAPASASGGAAGPSGSGEKPVKRMMKTPYQLDVLEQTYLAEQYPSEAMRAELSVKIGLSDRQLQMWFCHRRLKDRKPPAKRQRRDEEGPATPVPVPPPVLPLQAMPLASTDLMMSAVSPYDEPLLPPTHSRRGAGRSSAVPRISAPDIGRRYYEPLPVMLPPPVAPMHFRQAELRVITSVESQLGEPLREDGPLLGVDFDPLPPGAFGAPIVPEQQKQPARSYDTKIFSRHDPNLLKVSSFLPSMEHPFVPNSFAGKRKSTVGNPPLVHPHGGLRAVHEYQFLPEQPSDAYERASRSHYYDTLVEGSNSRIPSLTPVPHLLHGSEEMAPSYAFEGQGLLPQSGRPQVFPAVSSDYEMNQSNSNINSVPVDGQFGSSHVAGFEDPLISSETRAYHDEDASRVDRKRKHNEEAKIAKEVEAHEKRIRKELEKQDILRRKREEQMRKEMERHDRERRKEEERLLRERQREEERFQREQRREHERMEKFLQKQSRRAEKQRQKEELRKEKEMARQKAANERATARRIAREYMELVEDERLELMELAAQSKGLPSMLCLDSDTLLQLDSFRDMLSQFPPEMVRLKVPLSIRPWTGSEESVGKLLMVWKFLITFADVLELSSVTLDEFIQSLHDYDSRLLGELHVALLKSIIKDIEDVARTPSVALGVNPGGGHPQIVEGAYSWGFNIRNWQRHLNLLTWPEILRQFALSAGFGPQLKKRNAEDVFYRDENEGQDGQNVISTLRNGSAAVRAAALMKERGYTHRRSRHRLTPGTVKFAAFHVLSLEDSSGLTILEVAEKIQKSGLRDLTTSKTPEASIAAALSRDTKLFERTAPSTYCVKSPYRKDPAESEAVLSSAREKIRAFQNVLSDSEAEKEVDVDDVDRDEESDCDDDPDGDDVNIEVGDEKDPLLAVKAQGVVPTVTKVGDVKGDPDGLDTALTRPISSTTSRKDVAMLSLGDSSAVGTSSVSPLRASSDHREVITGDAEGTQIDESNQGESWVQGLAEGDYCDLSVEERLNALVALVGVATEGNSIRAVLEERLEAANAVKKQMWAEAQLDKRRSKEEFASKVQYNSYTSLKADVIPENNATETTPTPVRNLDIDNDENAGTSNNNEILNQQSNAANVSYERNGTGQDASATPDNLSAQQYAHADKTRSQLKSYIGHRAEQLYVYRSLPLGQDRRRNRYWQFSTSTSPNDPGSGRIFFESREGYWRIIDSEEVFDALVASLDTRGSREAQLHSMLQRVESTFKEGIKRKRTAAIEQSAGRYLKNGATDTMRASYRSEFGSPSSTLSSVSADSATTYSDSFKIELGRNDVEKISISKRADGFLKWMWRECCDRQLTCAMKYGKKRCSALLHSCNYCYQIYLAEERHCSFCHKTFKSIYNYSEHTSQCEEKRRIDPNWKMQIADYSVPIGMRLLKLQLATIEASIPSEALQPFWSDGYRKSWGVKLHSTTSVEEIFQMLTLLEGAIRRDCLSSDFETSNELLNNLKTEDIPSQNLSSLPGTSVLPWVPDTTAAITLRMLDLDYAVSYVQNQKKERDSGDSMLASRYTVKKAQDIEPLEPTGFDLYDARGPPSSGRRGRGRGSRGGSRGGRGRSRGGRIPRGISSSSRIEYIYEDAAYEKAPRKNARRGRGRGRGRRRGRRTVRPRQPSSEGRGRSIPKANLLGSFSMLSNVKPSAVEESPRSSGAEEWGLESRRPYIQGEGDENSSGSESDQSEDNEENGQPMDEEYEEEQVPDYSRAYSGGPRPHAHGMMDDETEDDDEDAEGDGEGDEEEYDVNQASADVDDEMDEDDDIGDDGDDGVEVNADEDEGATSYSSDYSE
ncbi:homeobox-DDT domain protein RLT2-like isoform X2 [Hordeum vulgare subsp. vulgare]|uniref:homeobox-DDT domain protein RLT2-like isoform X2 n=1 Tax=Hordeum vulgare subsp. vulgare TaxID=112509 RepID=UPI001D1A3A61|nr:homeobox-DDT domain protein RLT2-like isoform X2 [Hordeum vulgare subsp. vulgare]